LVDALAALGHTNSTIETLSEYALDHGHLADAPGLRGDERLVFQTATGPGALSPMAHLQMVAAVQPFISGGVSKTVPLPADTGVGRSRTSSSPPGAWASNRSPSTATARSSASRSPQTRTDDHTASQLAFAATQRRRARRSKCGRPVRGPRGLRTSIGSPGGSSHNRARISGARRWSATVCTATSIT
jgi:hypothetical protein